MRPAANRHPPTQGECCLPLSSILHRKKIETKHVAQGHEQPICGGRPHVGFSRKRTPRAPRLRPQAAIPLQKARRRSSNECTPLFCDCADSSFAMDGEPYRESCHTGYTGHRIPIFRQIHSIFISTAAKYVMIPIAARPPAGPAVAGDVIRIRPVGLEEHLAVKDPIPVTGDSAASHAF